jgi:hypothetical protein
MFSDPKVLAHSALELLELAKSDRTTLTSLAAVELGAATLANHVWDWHEKTGKKPQTKEDFTKAFPEWDLLRQISNGVKHAKQIIADPTNTTQREPEWEDDDYWNSDHGRATMFVEIAGRQRSISALVWTFANAYITAA